MPGPDYLIVRHGVGYALRPQTSAAHDDLLENYRPNLLEDRDGPYVSMSFEQSLDVAEDIRGRGFSVERKRGYR